MKNLIITTAAALSLATAAYAGGNAEAEMEPMVETSEVAPASSSAAGIIVPLLALLLLAAVASGSDDDTSPGMMYDR